MCADEIELWFEALDAREETGFQEKMKVDPMTTRHDKPAIDARRNALRASEYRFHDKLRIAVDLRKLR
jgi:hypothetical protein